MHNFLIYRVSVFTLLSNLLLVLILPVLSLLIVHQMEEKSIKQYILSK